MAFTGSIVDISINTTPRVNEFLPAGTTSFFDSNTYGTEQLSLGSGLTFDITIS
jgi:hypothetical protein